MNDNFTRNFSTRSNNVNNIERKSHNFSTNQKRLPTDWFARKGQQAIRKIFIGNFTPSQFTPYDRIWIGESMAAILILKNEFRSKRDPLFIVESNNIISIDVRSFEKKKKKNLPLSLDRSQLQRGNDASPSDLIKTEINVE